MQPLTLPAEWAPQCGVLLTWPHPHGDWAPLLAEVEPVFAAIAAAISRRETVVITCYDHEHRARVREHCLAAGTDPRRLSLWLARSNDTWVRDYGPIAVTHGKQMELLDFRFNGWGGKHAAGFDDAVTAALHDQGVFGDTPVRPQALILEGGSIDSDGEGTLLTTSSCLLSPGRNPRMDRESWEQQLELLFGARRVLWLDHGELAGDDTDGHVDTLARFCDPNTIAYVTCDEDDAHYPELASMAEQLAGFRTAAGEPYRLVPLPLPAAIHDEAGNRLPATHANFLIVNGAVLVPTYDDPTDAVALKRLGECFPGREVIGIDCRALIRQFGSLHCSTMQLPAGVLADTIVLEE